MNVDKQILDRVNYLIDLSNKALATEYYVEDLTITSWVDSETYNNFESASLSFIINIYGDNHPYYTIFLSKVKGPRPSYVEAGRGILSSIKTEIEKGWLITIKSLITAEIFTDFIETAEYLLKQNYKDPAAVIIGSVLEEHLRQLCRKNGITVDNDKTGKLLQKTADTINSELSNAGVYNRLDQKSVTAWLDLRNKAAHGLYTEYTKDQVETMLDGILNFINRNSL
ncbi:hypothetical protein [Flavobacterium rhizosphaerae]|uniref:DUF4145 domain-containing protein n=1 Tax=Flavobacterium rhizosphaerae TaxID=3163298 RepID=A0ABW8YYJ9_9FLAO